ncbi:molybdenum cofactor synthesis domain protein [Ferroglobus placidus DSM 10642]|uniref:Molybdenum cofactor synthesis domain protein n=1 Tax=Ferroglobus placidus (strain DSM 10642 / AEDII12DO) TaxID=589924 RepID=D3RYA2_FERPA|nr:MogA/MoaB family molybdenum cofactor biosynthesis protein [Ferroglobus placidus]ADC65465.1 molybdenum cofactor synthesis domain protein [Ferroglobus placidus DSM 10642]
MHEAEVDVKIGVITVSTSRYEKYGDVGLEDLEKVDDESGKTIVEAFKDSIVAYKLVPDDTKKILKAVLEMEADVVILTGGTGLNPRDVTVEALEGIFDKKMEGFGEVFRYESLKEIGYNAILSRATAGVVNGKVVFALPGSKKAVELGVKIIKDVLKHVVSHAKGLK